MSTRTTRCLSITCIAVALPLLACKLLGKKQEQSSAAPTTTVAASATATATAASTDTWKKLEPAGGEFEMIGPTGFEHTTQTTPSAIGNIDTTIYTASLGTTAYQLAHTDFPASVIRAGNAKKLLKDSEKGALDKVNAQSTSSKEITVQGNPGREFSATFVKEGISGDYAGRLILVKHRLYHLQVVSAVTKASEEDKQKFFTSFKLLKGAK